MNKVYIAHKWTTIAAVMSLTHAANLGSIGAQEAPGQFQDGQKAAFFGDSITYGGWYAYYVQIFYATRFPDRRILFENVGVPGASAAGSISRLDKDLFVRKPDWVYIMFGMNDVGRDLYKTLEPDEATIAARERCLKAYTSSMNATIKKIKAFGAVPVVMTPSPYNQYAAAMKTENIVACNDGLAKCAEIARTVATENHCSIVDLHAPLTELMMKDSESKLAQAGDRVHPDQTGHMVMAYYLLHAQRAPELVSNTVIDCAKKAVEKTENCTTEGLGISGGSVKFTYTAKALPFPVSTEYSKANQIVPWESLNQEILQLKNLPAGDYKLSAAGRDIGNFSAAQFASGVNIASLATPQQEKSAQISSAVIAKANADRPLRDLVEATSILWNANVDPADFSAADKCLDAYLEKVNERYKPHYVAVIDAYRANRNKVPQLVKAVEEAQERIVQLQKTEPYSIEVTKK